MASTRSSNPVACRYKMGAKDWSQSGLHPVPYDVQDFCEGIGNYHNGMMIISEPGYYQVNAMLGDVNLRIRKNSEFYSHGFGGLVSNILSFSMVQHMQIYLDLPPQL